MTFEELNLNKPLLQALADLEYINPTPIQEQVHSVILSGKNMVGIAQTGTGKTFAYLLPILKELKFSKQREPRVLIIAPTHELVIQIVNEIEKLTKYSSIRSLGIFGGGNMNKQKQAVYDGTDILVATPGRLLDIAYTGVLSLKGIKKLVIDEVDEMLNLGFRTQIKNILEILPAKRQNLMFSATLSGEIENLIANSFIKAEKVIVSPNGTPLDKIEQKGYFVPNFNTKARLLEFLLSQKEFKKVLIFTKSKKNSDKLYLQLNSPEDIGVIHSNKAHNTRLNAVNGFESGELKALIATDIIARGMDIADVTHVINFDLPENQGDYIHRIGRTGRSDKTGIAISFVNDPDRNFQNLIETMMNKRITMVDIPAEVEISDVYSEDDIVDVVKEKNYLPKPKISTNGAFHQKKEKNLKKNSGSASRHKAKYTKSGKKIKRRR